MTEEQWELPQPTMARFNFLRSRTTDRKLRLSACAYCRAVWPLLGKASRKAVELGEVSADRTVLERHREPVVRAAIQAVMEFMNSRGERFRAADMAYRVPLKDGWYAAEWTIGNWSDLPAGDRIVQDVFGNPFRPVTFLPSWRTETAVALAESMYAARDFAALPILADALQDAGCEDADVLGHCRGDGPHVRGCWVVDGVLGRK